MINIKRFPYNRFDNRKNTKDFMYSSSREIVRLIKKKNRGITISKSTVAKLIKKHRKYEEKL